MLQNFVFLFLRNGASSFSLIDVQEMDALVSTFNVFETKEAGPLFLAWAAFLYLLLTLPGKDGKNDLMVCGLVTKLNCFLLVNLFILHS